MSFGLKCLDYLIWYWRSQIKDFSSADDRVIRGQTVEALQEYRKFLTAGKKEIEVRK